MKKHENEEFGTTVLLIARSFAAARINGRLITVDELRVYILLKRGPGTLSPPSISPGREPSLRARVFTILQKRLRSYVESLIIDSLRKNL